MLETLSERDKFYAQVGGDRGPIEPPRDWKVDRVLTPLSELIDWSHGFFGLNPEFYDVDCSNVSIGILDTGIDTTHPDLKPASALDFTGSPNGPNDQVDHGSWCCGYVCALPNDVGVLGITANRSKKTTARLHSYKCLGDNGSGFNRWIHAALEAAIDNRLDVISCSWGGGPPDPKMEKLFNVFIDKGGFPFAAAGNSGNRSDEDYPAKFERVPGVVAVDKNGNLTNFSSTGPGVVGGAPGYQMVSTIPGGHGLMSGTSMAAPCYAGVWTKILAAILNAGKPRPTLAEAVAFIQKFSKVINGVKIIDPPGLLAELAKTPAPPPVIPPPIVPPPVVPPVQPPVVPPPGGLIPGGVWVYHPTARAA